MKNAEIIALCSSHSHSLNKYEKTHLELEENYGVIGDAHAGKLVKHRSRVKRDPNQANLRQIHLIHYELLEELKHIGFNIRPGQMGENITTKGIPLLDLPKNTLIKLGSEVLIKLTGLRNPCNQLNGIQEGLMEAVLDRSSDGKLIRKAGVMAIVIKGGRVKKNDLIEWILPPLPFERLEPV